MKKLVITAVLLLVAVTPLFAQSDPRCFRWSPVPITGQFQSPQQYTLHWDPLPGATYYQVEERIVGARPEREISQIIGLNPNTTELTIHHEAINDVTYGYTIRGIGPNGLDCRAYSTHIKTLADPVLRRAVRRGMIPVVGSARGANGSLFKTSLRLEGAGLRGKIVFHPANRVLSENDPSIDYDFTGASKFEWDDIVAAMGQSGLGSLSVIPAEGDLLPHATVRLYNVAPNGIFGTSAEMYPGVGFLNADASFQRIEIPADGSFRANVGARAILAGTAKALHVGADGGLKKTVERSFAAGEVVFGSPEAVYGVTLEPGDTLLVTFSRAIVPFYTLTDNRTNDPFLYVQGAERDDVVDQYVK